MMREGEGTEGEEKRHECRMNGDLMNTVSFSQTLWIVYTRITEAIYTLDGIGERGRRWVTHVT